MVIEVVLAPALIPKLNCENAGTAIRAAKSRTSSFFIISCLSFSDSIS
jgi:hypothetical protein